MSKILITGTGLLGSQLIKILSKNNKVLAIDKKPNLNFLKSIIPTIQYKNLIIKKIDLTNFKKLNDSFLDFKPKIVIHSAAILPMRVGGHNYNFNYISANINSSVNLIELAIRNKTKKFIFLSSSASYDFRGVKIKNELSSNHPVGLRNDNTYSNTKSFIDTLCYELNNLKADIEFAVVRPGNIYGPSFSKGFDYKPFWKRIFDASINNLKLQISNEPSRQYDYVYSLDLANLISLIALKKEKLKYFAYNGGGNNIYDINDFINIAKKINPKFEVTLKNISHGGWDYPLSNSLNLREFKFKPYYTLSKSFDHYKDWYIKNGYKFS